MSPDSSSIDSDSLAKLSDHTKRAVLQRKRFYARKPKSIADVMARLLAKRGYAAIRSDEVIGAAWAEAVGTAVARRSRVSTFSRGQLEVIVSSSAIVQELQFDQSRLLESLRRIVPDAKITSLRLRVGRLESPR
ncbi:DciA family protein [Botrimarina hoheduenensis]|uniref:DUF721 domain-containing protein n=1 Tax=Botrimarina hoheduenensis TaxID=2528000 RepID=A0A5C5WA04_9BACT|nr:DUF721 domain-containing protein [Botrimarina hoheduenensis]TWT46869.1 hypothetical protein Pla111_19710 [Botrimarina hoheduenensis]